MADTTEEDTGIQYLGLLTPALIALITGLVIHSFIIRVNVTDWWKGRLVTPVDLVVTSLAVSRMCAQYAITLDMIVGIFFISSMDSLISLGIMLVIYFFFPYANFWLTSLLSIVLYLKISNLHSRLFLYLRGVIVHRTVYFIGASVLLSVFHCLMDLFIYITELNESTTYNATIYDISMDCSNSNAIYSYIIGSLFPFLFYIISSVLLFTSLYHHTAKMKMSSNLSINLETYYSVMKLISATFIYNTFYFICNVTYKFYYYSKCENIFWLYTILGFLPALHSSYLIYRTAKLRSQMAKVLQNVTDFLFRRKDTETRENIEVVTL